MKHNREIVDGMETHVFQQLDHPLDASLLAKQLQLNRLLERSNVFENPDNLPAKLVIHIQESQIGPGHIEAVPALVPAGQTAPHYIPGFFVATNESEITVDHELRRASEYIRLKLLDPLPHPTQPVCMRRYDCARIIVNEYEKRPEVGGTAHLAVWLDCRPREKNHASLAQCWNEEVVPHIFADVLDHGRIAKEFFAFDNMLDSMVQNQSIKKASIPEIVQAVYIMNGLLNMMVGNEFKNEFTHISYMDNPSVEIRTKRINADNIKDIYFENIYKKVFLESSGVVGIREFEEEHGHRDVISMEVKALMLVEWKPETQSETTPREIAANRADARDVDANRSKRSKNRKASLLKRAFVCLFAALVFKFLILAFNAAWSNRGQPDYRPSLYEEHRDSRRRTKESQKHLKALPVYEPAVFDINRFSPGSRTGHSTAPTLVPILTNTRE